MSAKSWHYHLARGEHDRPIIRGLIFCPPGRWDTHKQPHGNEKVTEDTLLKLGPFLHKEFQDRTQMFGARGKANKEPPPPPPATTPSLPKAGERVDAILLEEKTKKGGWKARHCHTGISGPIQNSAAGPSATSPVTPSP
jgi:CRISPR-associated protein Cmr6